jgi:hypothetical protein
MTFSGVNSDAARSAGSAMGQVICIRQID